MRFWETWRRHRVGKALRSDTRRSSVVLPLMEVARIAAELKKILDAVEAGHPRCIAQGVANIEAILRIVLEENDAAAS